MECLVIAVILAAVAGSVGLLIAFVITLRRTRAHAAGIAELGSRLARLEARLEAPPTAPEPGARQPAMAAGAAAPERDATPLPRPPSTVAPPPRPAPASTPTTAPEPEPAPPSQPAPPSREAAPKAPSPPHAAPPPPPPPPASAIDWERWIGVRGAALLGGVVLALAGFLFLKYSIEKGWFPPAVRVAIGVAVGLGAILGSERLRRRGYTPTANALAGAGVVLLYATFWAARTLYELIGTPLTFVLMVLVTAAAGVLAWRHRSPVIAVLGLAGGFATPFLLSTGQDRPIALFGYLLLLNAGLLAVARRRGWPALGLLGIAGTALYEGWWIVGRMGPDRVFLGLAVLAVFAGLYAVAAVGGGGAEAERPGGRGPSTWSLNQAAAVLLPFLFALHLARSAELARHIWPVAALLALLSAAAVWLGRHASAGGDARWIPTGAAAGGLAVIAVWCLRSDFDASLAWEAAAAATALALVFHLAVELELRRGGRGPDDAAPESEREERDGRAARVAAPPAGTAALLAAGAFLALLVLVPIGERTTPLWPWLTGWLALAALVVRQSVLPDREALQVGAAGGLLVGFLLYDAGHRSGAAPDLIAPAPGLLFAVEAAVAIAFQLLALGRRRGAAKAHTAAEVAAGLLPAGFLAGLVPAIARYPLPPSLFVPVSLAFAVLAILALTRLRSGGGYFGVVALLAVVQGSWAQTSLAYGPAEQLAALALLGASALLATAWPFLAAASFRDRRLAWVGAALAGPLWFLPLKGLYSARFGDGAIGLLPVALGALSLAAAARAGRIWPAGEPRRVSALVWFAAVALGFVSLAIPLQLDREWITVGWALEGVAVAALWRRLDHPGLKWFGVALFAAVTLRLVANPAILGYHPRGGWPILNWLAYTYLLPAAAMLGAAALFSRQEVERRRRWEERLYLSGRPTAAVLASLAAIAVVFVWINLTIFDAFSTGRELVLSAQPLLARDLTLSLAWAVYALILLAVGMARDSSGLRWISLGFLVLTIGKVFLYDLGELRDLYRVASLVGLAISLIAVSLAYQRFVFRRASSRDAGGNGAEAA